MPKRKQNKKSERLTKMKTSSLLKTRLFRTKLAAAVLAIATITALCITVDNSFAQRGRGGRGMGPGMGQGFGGGFGPGFGGEFRGGPGRPDGPRGPQGSPAGGILRLSEELGLTDEQVTQIKAIVASATEAIEAQRETMQRLQEALQEAVTADSPDTGIIREIASQIGTAIGDGAVQRATVHQSVMAVLTAEQKAQLETLKAEREALREKMEELRDDAEALGIENDRPGRGFGGREFGGPGPRGARR